MASLVWVGFPLRCRLAPAFLALVAGLCWSAARGGVIISDSFNRANSDSLGWTDNALGGTVSAGYTERHLGGGNIEDDADIFGNRLLVHGRLADGLSGSGAAILNYSFPADITLSVEALANITNPTVGQTIKNMWMLQLRRPNSTGYYNPPSYSTSLGTVDIMFGINGDLFVRQVVGGASPLLTLYNDNPFIAGTAPIDMRVKPDGTLPTTFGGGAFDADGDGTLEANEPFTLGATLSGTSLDVLINGTPVATVGGLSAPGPTNYVALVKQRYSMSYTIDIPDVRYDNLVISGTGADPGYTVRKIWDFAPHNAFTDLVRFGDQWFVSFREASTHVVPPVGTEGGKTRILSSADGVVWTSAALLSLGADQDLRDGKITVTPDGRLMLVATAAPLASPSARQSYVWFSSDGTHWSAPQAVGQANYWLWEQEWHEGTCYGVAYGDTTQGSSNTTTRLYQSSDGVTFLPYVVPLNSQGGPNEVALTFLRDGTAVALVRREGTPNTSLVGTSQGDYSVWNFLDTGVRVGGPDILALPDGRVVAATRLYGVDTYTALSWLDPVAGTLTPFLTLPSGGDTSYPGMVWHDGVLWVSYYSSHEGKASIYLAQVQMGLVPEPGSLALLGVGLFALIRRRTKRSEAP